MSITTHSGDTYYVLTSGARTGAVGSLTLGLEWPDNSVAVATSTTGIVESSPGSYTGTRVAPTVTVATEYVIVWYDPSTDTSVTESLMVLPLASASIDVGVRRLRLKAKARQRTVTGRSCVVRCQYGDDGDEVPGAVTVQVVNSAGDIVFEDAAEESGDGFTALIPPSSLGAVDLLAAVWLADGERTDVTLLDVCSARLFTLADMRGFREMADTDAYPDALVEAQRIAAEDFVEASCGRAFVSRYHECTLSSVEWYPVPGLRMPHPDVTALRALLVAGEPVTTDELAGYAVGSDGYIHPPESIVDVVVVVAYEHGEFVPDAGRATLLLARHLLVNGPLDDRAIGLPVEGGGVVQLLTPGVRGAVTGIPEVDAFLLRYPKER